MILGDDDPPERIPGVEGQLRAMPNGDHLWAAVEYVRHAFGLGLARACALEEVFVSPLPVGDWVDRLRVASGGRIEFLPRQVELGEDYVAIAVDAEANVALAVSPSTARIWCCSTCCCRRPTECSCWSDCPNCRSCP